MTKLHTLFPLVFVTVLAGCVGPGSQVSTSSPVRQASYRCSHDATLSVTRSGSSASVVDSRGFETTMPASPAGQSTRYSEGIYALILEGRDATWFVSGEVPLECRR